jgi:Fic family protein
MKDQQKANAIATERVQILSPLLAEGLDAAKTRKLREQICSQTGLSERTLRRYLAQYREEGYDGCFLQVKIPQFCKRFSPGTSGELLC